MTDDTMIDRLEAEYEELQFTRFDFDDAWKIGQDLVATGRRDVLPIVIDIGMNGQTLFHAALGGSSPDNDQWVVRKNRVALRFHRSSLYIGRLLKKKGTTIEEEYGLPKADYAPFGGSVPIRIRSVGVVGTATVSGLSDHEDHRLVTEALRRHLAAST
jgi:uncharacterized protein (UPF0303 family)